MVQVTERSLVDAPPETVWDFICEAERYPEWIYFVREVFDTSEGPMGEGWVYHERAKPGPIETVSEWKVTEFEPPHLQVHEGRMPEMEAVLTMRLSPHNGGTRWIHSIQFRMLPGFRPLGWLLERTVVKWKMRSDFRRILSTAKKIIERERGE